VLDLVEGGNTWDEIVTVAKALEQAGVTIFNTGIGWHETRVPTIVTSVPAPRFAARCANSNSGVRAGGGVQPHQHADDAEDVIASGDADMVSMARPFWPIRNGWKSGNRTRG